MVEDYISAKEVLDAVRSNVTNNDGYVSLLAYSICRDNWLIKFRKEEENIKIVVSLIILSDLLLILIAYLCKIGRLGR